GRQIGLFVQKLLPKGYTHESERQFFLVSEMAVRHLKEIAELLQTAHSGSIPIVHPHTTNTKADDLGPEPYFFQWAASQDGRLGQINTKDVPVAKLLALLSEVQSTLVSGQGHSYLQVPPPQTLEQRDEALRKQFERC